MRIAIYDPLYSAIGHFERYNKYLLQLASRLDVISKVWYFDSSTGNLAFNNVSNKIISVNNSELAVDSQSKLNSKKGLNKFIYLLFLMRDYTQLIKMIRAYPIDLLLFSSNGTFPFWLVIRFFWKKPYGVSVISLRWIYAETLKGYVLRALYIRYLQSARIVFVTEDCYRVALQEVGISAFVLPDRFLEGDRAHADEGAQGSRSIIQLTTLGTLSDEKNPLNFVFLLRAANLKGSLVNYKIVGKAFGNIGNKLRYSIEGCSNIEFLDCYLKHEEFDNLMFEADFVVIPYDQLYTKYMTSGVMWDCFAARKPILCPDVPLFRYYIEKYQIGFIYDTNNLGSVLSYYSENLCKVLERIQRGYDDLFNDTSFEMSQRLFLAAFNTHEMQGK